MQVNKHNSQYSYTWTRVFLSVIWILGIFLGLYLSVSLTENSKSLVRTLLESRVSTVGLIANLFLPFIISAIVWKFKIPAIYLLLAFTKAICYGFCLCSIGYVFREAGWLLRWLFLFSDTCSSALLLWYWYRNITFNHSSAKDLYICGILAVSIALIDICHVIPFSLRLF